MHDLSDFLDPVPVSVLLDDSVVTDGQMVKHMSIYEDADINIDHADIVLAGIMEQRGAGLENIGPCGADVIRKNFYQLHCWHSEIQVADIGNIKTGASVADSYAAIKTVVGELLERGKIVILLGGSHDITLAQYSAYHKADKMIEATVIDAAIDLRSESHTRSENFLLDMLTTEPTLIRHYNHIGFQSYLVHPRMIETLDKLRFDCYRVGVVKSHIEEMEPVLRNSNMLSIDISAIKNAESPASRLSPNGLDGSEACTLTRYAGMSTGINSVGIYGYNPNFDREEFSAKQIAHMLWYFIDGKYKCLKESNLSERENFNEYHIAFGEIDTLFLQSKKTSRWWMKMPDNKFIACSYDDYLKASRNEIPERWLRVQERI